MTEDAHPQRSEPHVLDQPWRIWSTVAVMSILLAGILLGVVVIPIVQGRGAGLDAYTAICRALGHPSWFARSAAARGQDTAHAGLAGHMDAGCLANPCARRRR